jgi:hypothetical protein
MKFPHLHLLPLLLLALHLQVAPASAQQNDILDAANRRREKEDTESAQAAQKRLAQAAASRLAEAARSASDSTQPNPLAARAATATPPEASLMEKARSIAGETQLSTALANLSEEGRKAFNQPIRKATTVEDDSPPTAANVIVAQNTTPAPSSPTPAGNPATPPPATQASPGSPKPLPLKPTPLLDAKVEANRTLIYSDDSFFDANRAIGIFTGNVRVFKIVGGKTDLYVECDDLEVFMKKTDSKTSATPKITPTNTQIPAEPLQSNATTKSGPTSATPEKANEAEESGIDKIRARGAMVIVEKYTETGDIQVGKCKDLTFDGVTKIVTLRIWPQVQRGANLQIADEPGTVMTITPEGNFKSSNGRTRTEILQGDAAKPKTKGLRRVPDQ